MSRGSSTGLRDISPRRRWGKATLSPARRSAAVRFFSSVTRGALLAFALLAASCASSTRATTARVEPPVPPAAALPPAVQKLPDPVTVLIEESERHFSAGQRDVELGHLERAKTEFDLALDLLLESPDGARSDPRLREHFDRLVDRISALEQRALAAGDGFTETKSEPATIDALLESSRSRPLHQPRPLAKRSRPTSNP